MTEALVEHKSAADEPFVQIAQIPRISIQAFCESPAIAQVVEQAAADRRMAKAQVKVNMGGVAAAIEAFRSAPTPNLIVVESTSERAELMANLDMLAEFCDSGTKVLVIGHENDIALYRALIARGRAIMSSRPSRFSSSSSMCRISIPSPSAQTWAG